MISIIDIHQTISSASKPDLFRMLQHMNGVAGFHSLDQRSAVILGCVNQIHTGLVKGNRISRSQSTDRRFITLIYRIFPSSASTTDFPASAMLSVNGSCSPPHGLVWLAPAVWIRHFPSCEARPIEMFLTAPPNPAMACPLKWDKTRYPSDVFHPRPAG